MATVVNSAEGSWSLADVKNRKKVVTSKTATYKVNDVVVATITGLSTTAAEANLTVTKGAEDGADTISIADDALGTSKVTLTLSNNGSYGLALASDSDGDGKIGFDRPDPAWVLTPVVNSKTKATTSNTASYQTITAKGYTLTNAKTITYTAPVTTKMATVTGLSKGSLEVSSDGQSIGITTNVGGSDTFVPGLSFGTGDNANVITLKNTALNGTNIALTNGKDVNGKATSYTLALADEVDRVNLVDGTFSQVFGTGKSAGTMTVKGNLDDGYTLNAKATGVTYSAAKTGQVIATISGLSSTASEETVVVPSTTNADSEKVVLTEGAIKLTEDALANKTVTLTSNYYTLDTSGISAPTLNDDATWTISNKGVGTLKASVDPAGYMLSTNEKTLTYIGSSSTAATLATISGLKYGADTSGISVSNAEKSTDTRTVTLSQGVLGTGTIKVASGVGYVLALDTDSESDDKVNTDDSTEQTVWRVSGTTATYKKVIPAYYTIDADTNVITYHKEQDVETYATIKGLKSGLKVSENNDGTESKIGVVDSETGKFTEAITVSDGKFTVNSKALGTTNVTITSDNYSLALDDTVAASAIAADATTSWTVNKGTATYKATATTKGYKLVDGTIVYTAAGKNTTLATVTGLKTTLTNANFNTTSEDDEGNTIIDNDFVRVTDTADDDSSGAVVRTNGVITLKKDSLDITNVKLTTNYDYTLALDSGVSKEGTSTTTWKLTGDNSAKLRIGAAAYYTLGSDSASITYTAPTYNETALAKLSGIASGLSVADDGSIDGIKVQGSKITLSENVLGKQDVTLTNGSKAYTLALSGVSAPVSGGTGWKVYGTAAILRAYTTEGYALSGTSMIIDYTGEVYGNNLAIVSGLKSGLKVEDGQISGISVAGGTITLSKSVLGTGNMTLANKDSNNYRLSLATDVTKSTTTGTWTSANARNGTAVYTVTTTAGYKVTDSGATITNNKKAAVATTITGLKKNATGVSGVSIVSTSGLDDDGNTIVTKSIDGIKVDLDAKTITLSEDALNKTAVTISGGSFALALDNVDPPKISYTTTDNDKNEIVNWSAATNKGVATLKGHVSQEGYTQTSDTTIAYTKESDDEVTLVTLSGLKPNLTADEIRAGVSINKNTGVITLSKDVLTTANVTIANNAGGTFSLALADNVVTNEDTDKWKEQTEWVTSGNTATYKTYNKGYYTLNAKGQVVYTKPTTGTTHATLTGIASGTDINSLVNGEQITLAADQLAKKNVALTNKAGYSFSVALDNDVTTSAEKVENEWTTSGNTATCKNYNKGYYKKNSGTSITYVKESNVTTLATISGVSSTADISKRVGEDNTITLTADDIATKTTTTTTDDNGGKVEVTTYTPVGKNIVLKDSSQTYSLALATDDATASITSAASDPVWSTKYSNAKQPTTSLVVATYTQTTVGKTYTPTSSTQITYSAKDAVKTLATISGLSHDLYGAEIDDSTEEYKGLEDSGINVSGTVITLDKGVLPSTTNGKVTLASTAGYTLALGDDLVDPTTTEHTNSWTYTVAKGVGTGTYGYTQDAGFVVSSDKKTITNTAGKAVTVAKITGLSANLYGTDEATGEVDTTTTILNDEDSTPIAVSEDEDTGKTVFTLSADAFKKSNVTLSGANCVLAVDEDSQPKAFEHPKWYVSKTTATLKDGKTEGYTATNATTIKYTAETAPTTLATVTGLKSGLVPNSYGNIDGLTATVENDLGLKLIEVAPAVLGATTVKVSGDGYVLETSGVEEPEVKAAEWNTSTLASKGTVSLTQTTVKGFTLSEDSTTLAYTAGKTATLSTVSGLNKSFSGDIDNAISYANKVITVEPALLTTSNAVASSGYTLALGDGAVVSPSETTGWVTSGTTATYKTYNVGYYTVNAKGQIVYTKPTAGTTHVTVTGLKSGTDLSSSASDTSKVITLTEDQLTTSNVAVKNATGYSYTLALADDVPKYADESSWKGKTEWVTSGTTATFKENFNKNSYTLNAAGTGITVTKSKVAGTVKATVVGVKTTTLSGKTGVDTTSGVVSLTSAQVNDKVTISGAYAFNFTDDYDGYITGSKAADTVTFAGDGASLSAGNGNDSITYTGSDGYVDGGAGADTIEASGFGVTISGGAGNDSITLGNEDREDYGDTIVYTVGHGADTIEGFSAYDTIKVTNLAISASNITMDGGETIINVNSGKTKGSINLGNYDGDITIIDKTGTAKTYTYSSSDSAYVDASTITSNDLLRDDNYVTMTPQLSSIVNSASDTSLGDLNLNNLTNLTQKDTVITYSGDK